MDQSHIVTLVEDLFAFKNPLETPVEIIEELSTLGMTIADAEANPDLIFEAGIARNIRRACNALGMPVSPHQSLTLAKHMRVGNHYRKGVPLSDHERTIALRLLRIHFEKYCEENGEPFTDEHARDCERMVRFGENGLHIGHKIGEASGCFKSVLLLFLSFAGLVMLYAVLITSQ